MATEAVLTTYGALGVDLQKGPVPGRTEMAIDKNVNFNPSAQELMGDADLVVTSWDLDGVMWSRYDDMGNPIVDNKESRDIYKHTRRLRAALAAGDARFMHILNTNREFPALGQVMDIIDPQGEQTNQAGAFEAGHAIAYRTQFDPASDQYQIESTPDGGERVVYADGSFGTVQQQFPDGSRLVTESLLDAPHMRDIRVGEEQLSLGDARARLMEMFQAGVTAGQFGAEAWMPDGRIGMITARKAAPDLVVANGEDLSQIKKWMVPDGSPIMGMIRGTLGIVEGENLPFDVIYYPFDGGLDVQFKGLNKKSGARHLMYRLKSLGIVAPEEKVAVAHLGDSGSDAISDRDDELQTQTAVVALGNADQGLIDNADALATYPVQRGARQVLYNMTDMANRIAREKVETVQPGSLEDHLLSYLGREGRHEGDIDIREMMANVDIERLEVMKGLFERARDRGGRVFFIGNGGSYDNAVLCSLYLRQAGIESRTPGNATLREVNARKGFSHVFSDALQAEGFTDRDLVVGISGSGNSPNVLLAQDYAQRVRLNGNAAAIQTLLERGYSIDTSLLGTTPLTENEKGVEPVATAIAGFDASVAAAMEQAEAAGDDEAMQQLRQLQESNTVAALGGRDGGAMRRLAGDNQTFLAVTECMEALEDAHPQVIHAIAGTIASEGRTINQNLDLVRRYVIENLRKPEHIKKIVDFAKRIEAAVFKGGRLIIVGNAHTNPAVTHAQADWGRGAINMAPISGPEILTVDGNLNAMMATGNDDGPDYVYADQLSKFKLGENDTVLFVGPSIESPAFEPCIDIVDQTEATSFVIGTDIGERKADIPFRDSLVDLGTTSIIHAVSRGFNEYLRDERGKGWHIEPIDVNTWEPAVREWVTIRMKNQRTLNRRDTLKLEDVLHHGGELTFDDGRTVSVSANGLGPDNVVTFTYGKPYKAEHPKKYNLERGFY